LIASQPQIGRIFISYRRADSAGYAGRIYDRLTAHFGEDAVFMDVDTIEAGLDFVEVLQNAVQSCDVLVALIGQRWLTVKDENGERRLDNPEDFVRVEIAAALDRNIRVIPVLVDGTTMPRSTELPRNLKPLARRNALQVNHHSFNADAYRLISQLELALKAAEDSKILKARALQEEQARAQHQTEIERLLAQVDLAIGLKDWQLAHEKLSDVLKLDASHLEAQDKLDIVQRKISEIEEERAGQARKEKEAREQAAVEERARLAAEQQAQKEREDRERREAEEKARKEKEEQERKATPAVPVDQAAPYGMLRESLTHEPPKQPVGRASREASPKGDSPTDSGASEPARKPAWLPYGIAGAVILACVLIFWIGSLLQNALSPDSPTATKYAAAETPAPVVSPDPATLAPTATTEPQATPTSAPEELGVGSTMISEKDGVVMMYVPAGDFQMGSETGDSDEKPVHTLYLDAFWIDIIEVTNALYAECVDTGDCNEPSSTKYYSDGAYDNHPVVYVSWNDASTYCAWVDGRLPTEAEWEKAARGGLEGKAYPWGDDTPVCEPMAKNGAQYSSCGGQTVRAGNFGQNGYGLYDMSGNVLEWVSSLYQSYPYSTTDGREDLSASGNRVLRGGSWIDSVSNLRTSYRNDYAPSLTPRQPHRFSLCPLTVVLKCCFLNF